MTPELIKKAKNGNKEAFSEIILYYQNDLYKIAKARLNRIDDVEDAIQETIISAYKSISKLKNISKLKSWLITILINQCKYIYKKQQEANTISYELDFNEIYIAEDLESDFDINCEFNNLMNLLNVDDRTILILYYAEGYKSKEIAKILKMNESTVRNRISKARQKIEKNLEGGIYNNE